MISICCTPENPDYKNLSDNEKQRFGFLVWQFKKQGIKLEDAQYQAYYQVLCEGIPFEND
jgi:hypothetical protein